MKNVKRIKKENNMKKRKNIFIGFAVMILLGVIIFTIFFRKNMSKNFKIGNNSTSQEIIDYILNIGSYNTQIEVEVNSNKNTNKYILKQEYISPDINSQEVLEPTNIAGVKIIRDGQNLRLENTNLNLSTVFEKYEYIADNDLDLSSFIKDYKGNNDSKFEEKNEQLILKTSLVNNKTKILYIDKSTATPTKMIITDYNKNSTIYILYNKVNVNS